MVFEVLLADHVKFSSVTEQLVSILRFLFLYFMLHIVHILAGINVTTALSNPQKQFVKVSG